MKNTRTGNTLRIIGGQWRSRRLQFPDIDGLRPTPDRVRETLFNWLAPVIEGARCLDLFAGSGAMGLEALSRGAAQVLMLDRDPRAANQIRAHLKMLGSEQGQVLCADALNYLQSTPAQRFDIVFLDPPFRRDLLDPCCALLEQNGWLAAGALIYIEAEREFAQLPLPAGWEIIRDKQAGQVGYYLVKRKI